MSLDTFQPWLVVVVALVMGWFAAGVIYNIRHGNAVLRWLQEALPRLGEKTTLRWLGTSVVELKIERAKPPFRRVHLLLVMEPRDVPWLWLPARLARRRDTLIFRSALVSAPRLEYEIGAAESWTGRQAIQRAQNRRWSQQPLGDHQFMAPSASQSVSFSGAENALREASLAHKQVWLLSARREFPQLELHIPFPSPRSEKALEFVEALRSLGRQVSSSEFGAGKPTLPAEGPPTG